MILLADDLAWFGWIIIWPMFGFAAGTIAALFHMSKEDKNMQRQQKEEMAYKDREIEYWKGKAIHG
jgi:hypothetical protein